jgi:hypothetical protein
MESAIAETAALRCLRCGYDLRGLAPAGMCPECGLAICVSFFLFLIWSAYLMTRFAIEFRRAARSAKQSWIEADAALPVLTAGKIRAGNLAGED